MSSPLFILRKKGILEIWFTVSSQTNPLSPSETFTKVVVSGIEDRWWGKVLGIRWIVQCLPAMGPVWIFLSTVCTRIFALFTVSCQSNRYRRSKPFSKVPSAETENQLSWTWRSLWVPTGSLPHWRMIPPRWLSRELKIGDGARF